MLVALFGAAIQAFQSAGAGLAHAITQHESGAEAVGPARQVGKRPLEAVPTGQALRRLVYRAATRWPAIDVAIVFTVRESGNL